MTLTHVDLPTAPMADFVAFHPCEVWADGKFQSRFTTMLCAARSMVQFTDGFVKDVTVGAEEVWDKHRCLTEINRSRPVSVSNRGRS